MAVSYVGASAADGSGIGDTVTIAPPAGVQEGDVLIVFVGLDPVGTNVTTPAGWTAYDFSTYGPIWAKVATASEPADYTFSGGSTTTGNSRQARMWAYRGAVGLPLEGGVTVRNLANSGTTAAVADITTTFPNATLLSVLVATRLSGIPTDPFLSAGWTERFPSTTGAWLGEKYLLGDAGLKTGEGTWTWTNNATVLACTLALDPGGPPFTAYVGANKVDAAYLGATAVDNLIVGAGA